MAKLGLIFICVFLMVQLSTSAPQRKESGSDGNESTFRGMMNDVMATIPKEVMKLSLAARVVRDAPTKTEAEETNSFNLNEALSQLTQGIQKAFSKESVDKFMENLGETGEKFKEFGQGLINRAQQTAAELTKKDGEQKE